MSIFRKPSPEELEYRKYKRHVKLARKIGSGLGSAAMTLYNLKRTGKPRPLTAIAIGGSAGAALGHLAVAGGTAAHKALKHRKKKSVAECTATLFSMRQAPSLEDIDQLIETTTSGSIGGFSMPMKLDPRSAHEQRIIRKKKPLLVP